MSNNTADCNDTLFIKNKAKGSLLDYTCTLKPIVAQHVMFSLFAQSIGMTCGLALEGGQTWCLFSMK